MKAFAIVPVLATAAAAKEALGCYPSLDLGDSANSSTNLFNTYGSCRSVCSVSAHKYTALQGDKCVCVDKLPAAAPLSDDQCDQPCPGFVADICGGKGEKGWTILDTKPEIYHPSNVGSTATATGTVTSAPYPTVTVVTSTHVNGVSNSTSTTGTTSSSTRAPSGTSTSAPIPAAAAVSGSVYLGSVAAAIGLGVVAQLF